mgnify:CR=1 FL=1
MADKTNNRLELVEPVEEISSRAQLACNTANELQVNSQSSLEHAGEIIRVLKDLQDEVNKVFKPIVEQAFKAHKTAKAAQNQHLEPLQQAESSLRSKINLFLREQELEKLAAIAARLKAEENLKQQPAAQKPTFSASAVPAPRLPEIPPSPKVEGMTTVLEWKWKVTDSALIPAGYWQLDEEWISAEVRRLKEKTEIPGIEVFSESRVVVKR